MYTLILSAALLADATLVQTMKVEMNPNMPMPPGEGAEAIKMFAEPRDFVFELQGAKMRSVLGQFEAVYSLDTGKMQVIDRSNSRYATSDIGDVEALARAMRPQAGAKSGAMSALGDLGWLKAKLVHLGERGTGKSAAGIECRVERYALTFLVKGQPPDDRMAKAMTAQRMEIDYCLAPAPPELVEYQAAQARLSELMSSFVGGGGNQFGELLGEPMRKLQAEIFGKKQMPVQFAMRMYMDVRKMLPEGAAVPDALAALADAPLMTMTLDTKSYEAGAVDAAHFTVPAGLREVPLWDLDLRKLIAAR